jgi:hypothetical protein
MFAAGAAIGSAVSWKLLETKYRRIADEEIERQCAYYKQDDDSDAENEEPAEGNTEIDGSTIVSGQLDLHDYMNIINEENYAAYSDNDIKEVSSMKRPYVIKPEEFGEIDYYDTETLYYYADGVLTDDGGNPIEDVEDMVGLDSLDHFGDYEDDSVHVRNDEKKIDYEILRELSNYSDDVDYDPHSAEDE